MVFGTRWLCAAVTVGLLAAQSVSAQSGTGRVTGRVLETASQGPLANVSVTVVGSTLGTLTRPDGGYVLPAVPAGAVRLRVARIGYSAKDVAITVVAGQTVTQDVALDALAAQLSGVVTIGYGTQEARNRTGSVETITEKTFNTGRVISPEQLIQAKVPGVQIVDNNEPGGGIAIRIRGGTSINASNEPLFVVDGVPLQVGGGVSSGRNPLNFLNPGDIESMSVLKDASATAIYGSRGANGVIIITTKSGAQGTKVTYGSSYSSSTVIKNPNFLDATAYKAAVQQYAPENVSKLGSANTNWLDAIQQAAGGQEQNVAVAGGKDAMRYRLSLNYLNQDGVILGTAAQRIASTFNYSDRLFDDRLDVKLSLKGSRNDDWFTPGGVLSNATALAPTQPIRNADGSFFQWADPLGANNPLSDLALIADRGQTYRSVGNMEARYRLPWIDGLAATVRAGYDFAQSSRTTFQPSKAQGQLEQNRGGRFDQNNPRQVNSVLEVFGNYARTVDALAGDINVTAGYTYEQSNGFYPSFYAEKLSSDLLGLNGIPAAQNQQTFFNVQDSKLISGFARVNYTMQDKYLLEASIRRDGSSRFGPGNQWGLFPSISGAWRLFDEPFLQVLKDKTPLSDLKLRASWGVNGNQSFGNYLFVSTYTPGGSQAQVQLGNEFISTIRPSAVDPSIKWEQTKSTNIGFDFGFLKNRITGTLDYYNKRTSDLIFNVPVAAGTNLSNYVTTNIGSMENRGIELGVSARIIEAAKTGAFSWDGSLALANNTNKLLSVNANAGGSDKILTGGIAGGVGNNIQVLQPGYAVNSFFVYRHKKGSDGKPVTGAKSDKELYEDINGDGSINQSDRVAYKSPQPKWIIGHTTNMAWRRFDLALTARAYLGNYVYNNVASNLGNYQVAKGSSPANIHASVKDYGFTTAQYFSDLYVEDASFLRLDNITLGYTLPATKAFQSLRVFGTIQNVFTWTKYSGIDPLAGVNGIDNSIYPLSRTFTAGINVTF